MKLSELIPKGTHIKIASEGHISRRAYGLVFKTLQDVTWGHHVDGLVLEDPNGWYSKDVTHKIGKDVDMIVRPAYVSNSEAKIRLDIL